MTQRRTRGKLPAAWYAVTSELAVFGYEDDGIMWLAATPETDTRERALT